MTTTYKTAFIAGRNRLTRTASVLAPLPVTRCARQVNRYARVSRDTERTQAKPSPRVWEPGMILTRT